MTALITFTPLAARDLLTFPNWATKFFVDAMDAMPLPAPSRYSMPGIVSS
jgi:hypothetical protein